MTFFAPENLRAVASGRWIQRSAVEATPSGVGIDTRADLANRIFVAIRGPRHDGHDFLREAQRQGATLFIVDRDVAPDGLPSDADVLQVADARTALTRLAAAYRRSLTGVRVVAVTGSAGKTTTKRLIHAALSTSMRGRCAEKSFNNEIGVPLTLLSATPQDKYLVVEVGANAPGEIAALARIVEPDVALITMIGRAHLEGFGSLDVIAAEKSSLLRWLRPGGLAIVNAASTVLEPHLRGVENLVTFGEGEDADLRLTDWTRTDEGRYRLEVNGRAFFELPLPGRHNALNAVAAIAAARRVGADDDAIRAGLAAVEPEPMRMEASEIGGVRMFNDAYNANPDSMGAALETFVDAAPDAKRRIVVLGEMLELGSEAEDLHRELGRAVIDTDTRAGLDLAVFVGPWMSSAAADELRRVWPDRRVIAMSELDSGGADAIASMFQPGDAVLLKGSRGVELERIAAALARRDTTTAAASE